MVNNKEKMRKKTSEIISIVLVFLTIAGTIGAIFFYESILAKRRDAVYLYATPISTWEPKEIIVEKGKPVRIWIRNMDTVMHGFYLKDFNIGPYEIKAGHNKLVEFTPPAVGEYIFECTVMCSTPTLHDAMKGLIIVK